MFDEQKKVTYILDEDFTKAKLVIFHPLRNDMSISLTPKAFLVSMEKLGHLPKIMHIPVQES